MYHDLAPWWPLISPTEDYAAVGEILRTVFRERLRPGRHSLLDLGVGGGRHLSHLTSGFDAVGVDLSEEMLAHSRALNPTVEHHVGDMRSIRLDRKFDAVLIHDAVTCLCTEADLRAAFATAGTHLKPGGVLVMCPDWFRETFPDEFVSHSTHRRGNISLTYIEYFYDPDPTDTMVEMINLYMIREHGRLRIEQDRQTLGMFPKSTWLDVAAKAGFDVEMRPSVEAYNGEKLELLVGRFCP